MYLRRLALAHVEEPKDGYEQMVEFANGWQVPVLPVNGHDLLAKGLKDSELGQGLKALEGRWVESGFALGKAELLN